MFVVDARYFSALAVSFMLVSGCSAHAEGVRFMPNSVGDEVVDAQTGLIWRRCAEGQVWTGRTCRGTLAVYYLGDALIHAQNVASSTGVAWRVPNVKELQSIVDRQKYDPAIDVDIFKNTRGRVFWTSTPYMGGRSADGWVVNFKDGNVDHYGCWWNYAVRLVRDGQ